MSMPEPFKTVQDAIIAALLAESVTCYDHHPIELYGTPSAYLSVSDVLPDYERADQGEILIGRLDYKLRYYVSLEDAEQLAYQNAYTGARSIMAAFASGTLSGAVRSAQVERMAIDPVQTGVNGRPMLLVECDVVIRPAQYS